MFPRKSVAGGESNGDSRIEMGTRNMSKRVNQDHDGGLFCGFLGCFGSVLCSGCSLPVVLFLGGGLLLVCLFLCFVLCLLLVMVGWTFRPLFLGIFALFWLRASLA
ncbi:hypothetical protein QYF36_015041 [Acer negundo]|nr:hypothetical protein QYF36_015041 [Acer negundo]